MCLVGGTTVGGWQLPACPVPDVMRMSRTHSESRRAPAHGRLARMPRSGRVGTGATAAARAPAPVRGTRAPAHAARCAPGAAWGGGVERHGVSAPAGGGARGLWRWMAGMVSQRCECASSHYMTNCVTYICRTTIKKHKTKKRGGSTNASRRPFRGQALCPCAGLASEPGLCSLTLTEASHHSLSFDAEILRSEVMFYFAHYLCFFFN